MGLIRLEGAQITGDRVVDAGLDLVHQRLAGAEQMALGLGAAAQGLVEMLAHARMQLVEGGAEFGVEVFHAGKALRRFQVEHLHQGVIPVQFLFAFIAHQTQAHAAIGDGALVMPVQRQRFFAQGQRFLWILAQQRRLGGARQQIGIGVPGQRGIERRRSIAIAFQQHQGAGGAGGGHDVIRVNGQHVAVQRMGFLAALFLDQEGRLVEHQVPGPGRAVIRPQRFLRTVHAIEKLVIGAVQRRIDGIIGQGLFEHRRRILGPPQFLQYFGAQHVQLGNGGIECLRGFEIFQRFFIPALGPQRQGQVVVQHALQAGVHVQMQAAAGDAFGFLHLAGFDQQGAERQSRFCQVRLQGNGGAVGLRRIFGALETAQRGAVIIGQHGVARRQDAALRENPFGFGDAALLQADQTRQQQHRRMIGQPALEQGRQYALCAGHIALLQGLARRCDGLFDLAHRVTSEIQSR